MRYRLSVARLIRTICFVALALLVAVPAAGGPAELVEEARGHFDFGEYRAARDLTARALAAGTLKGAALRAAHALAGQCELELGNDAAAQAAFCAAWKADPKWDPSKEDYREPEREAIERARLDCSLAAAPTGSAQTPKGTEPSSKQSEPVRKSTPGGTDSRSTDEPAAGQKRDTVDRAETHRKPWYQRPIAWVGGLAVAAGAIVLMGGGGDGGADDPGDGGTPPLDDFPAPPDPPGTP